MNQKKILMKVIVKKNKILLIFFKIIKKKEKLKLEKKKIKKKKGVDPENLMIQKIIYQIIILNLMGKKS